MEKDYEKTSSGFVSMEKPLPIDWDNFFPFVTSVAHDDIEVTILRPSLYFCEGQKITLGKMREFFTNKGITLLANDGYIKIKTS